MASMLQNLKKMINNYFKNLTKYLFLLLLRLRFRKNTYENFKDLNFKQNDFTNYKIIKHYILKNNFINNITIQDIHSFNFLLFYQKLGGKKGIDLSKENIFGWFDTYKYYMNFPWKDDYASKRFINILYNYDFILMKFILMSLYVWFYTPGFILQFFILHMLYF